MGWFDRCFPRRRIISDSDGAESSRTGSPQKPADVVRIAASDDEKRKKLIQRHYDSGEAHIQAERYEEARDDFTRVIALNEKYSGAFAYRGSAYLGLEQFNEALADLNHALEMDEKNIFACAHRGIVHQEMGHYREAWADFTKALANLVSSRPWINDEFKKLCQCIDSNIQIYEYYKSGEKHIRAERYNEARDDFTRVIALNEECSWAFAYRGRAYLGLGQLHEAMTDLNHALELDKKNTDALKYRGVVHRKMGQYEKAWADFTKVCARGYSRPWIVKELCWLILRSVWACVKVKDSDSQIDKVKRHRQQEKSNDKITCEETKCIDKYQKELDLYQKELKTVHVYSNAVYEQWEQYKQNIMDRHKAVFADSKQVLDEYNSLKEDPKAHEERGKIVNNLLEKVEKVEEDIRGVKERHSTISSLRKECIKPVWELMRNISKKEKLKGLRAEMQKASVKPIDKVCAQWWKLYKTLYKERKNILDVYNYDIKRVLLSADKLLEKFLELQKSLDLQCSSESREKVNKLVKGIIQCFTEALELTKPKRKLDTSFSLEEDLRNQLPSDYNFYYSRGERVTVVNDINSTVLGPCAVMTTMRALSKFGIDLKEDATEKKIVKLVNNDVINGGTPAYEIQKAYQHYGFDYKHYEDKVVTIDDIQRITEQGHVIDVCVSKPGIAHSLLIEGIKKTENDRQCRASDLTGGEDDYTVILYDPCKRAIMKVPYKELKIVLDGRCTLPSEEQMKTPEPLLKAKSVMRILKCKNLAEMNIEFIMGKVEKLSTLSRKDRIQCYAYCFDKLKRQIQQSEGDLKLSDEYKEIKGNIESALINALKGKDSLFHRYATFSLACHKERETGEMNLIKNIKTLVKECQAQEQDLKQEEQDLKQKKLQSGEKEAPKLIEDLNQEDENFKNLIDNIDDDTRDSIIDIYYDYGKYNIREGRYQEARDNFTRVIALDEGSSGAFAYRGTAYLGLGQLDKASGRLKSCAWDG